MSSNSCVRSLLVSRNHCVRSWLVSSNPCVRSQLVSSNPFVRNWLVNSNPCARRQLVSSNPCVMSQLVSSNPCVMSQLVSSNSCVMSQLVSSIPLSRISILDGGSKYDGFNVIINNIRCTLYLCFKKVKKNNVACFYFLFDSCRTKFICYQKTVNMAGQKCNVLSDFSIAYNIIFSAKVGKCHLIK